VSEAYVYYPEDWVVVANNRICPRSVWNDRVKRAKWLEDGVIPDDTPELKRVCKIANLADEEKP
jgi:hypothetical protein